MCGAGDIWEISVLPSQFVVNLKLVLKIVTKKKQKLTYGFKR